MLANMRELNGMLANMLFAIIMKRCDCHPGDMTIECLGMLGNESRKSKQMAANRMYAWKILKLEDLSSCRRTVRLIFGHSLFHRRFKSIQILCRVAEV